MAIAELRRRPTKKPKYKNILMMETINANFKIAVHKKKKLRKIMNTCT